MEPLAIPTSIDLKLISCKDLKAFNFFQKLTIYALVSIASYDPERELKKEQKQQHRTKTDRESDGDGSNPEWNHEMKFDLGWISSIRDCSDLFISFEFRHEGFVLGDKLIGECKVPLEDLIRDAGGCGVARFVSYEVRSGDGKPNGIFDFSYRLNGIQSYSPQILDGRISGYQLASNQSYVQYPISEIGNPNCSMVCPMEMLPVAPVSEGLLCSSSAEAPPPVSSPLSGENDYCHFYQPPSLPTLTPYAYPYPPPPLPPVAHGTQCYPPFGPGASPWPSGPNFEHRW